MTFSNEMWACLKLYFNFSGRPCTVAVAFPAGQRRRDSDAGDPGASGVQYIPEVTPELTPPGREAQQQQRSTRHSARSTACARYHSPGMAHGMRHGPRSAPSVVTSTDPPRTRRLRCKTRLPRPRSALRGRMLASNRAMVHAEGTREHLLSRVHWQRATHCIVHIGAGSAHVLTQAEPHSAHSCPPVQPSPAGSGSKPSSAQQAVVESQAIASTCRRRRMCR